MTTITIDAAPIPSYSDQREYLNDEIFAFKNKPQESTLGLTAVKPQGNTMPVTTKILNITPDDARKYLANMVNNRPLSLLSVKTYAAEMTAGRWAVTGQGVIFDEKGRLLDGQHRLHAVIKSGKTIPITATYGINADTFSLMDGGHKRSSSDVIGCKNATTVAAALKLVFQENNGAWWNNSRPMRPADAIATLEKFPGIESSAAYVAGNAKLRKVLPAGQAAYCHFRCGIDAPERREAFFVMLSTGAGLAQRSPILALRNALAYEPGKTITVTSRISSFIRAWTLVLDHRQVGFLRVTNEYPVWKKALV